MIGKVIAMLVVSLLVGLIRLAPADKLVPRLLPADSGIQLYEISGRLLQGKAGQIVYQRQSADDLHWQLHPSALLMGRLSSDVTISQSSMSVSKDNAWLQGEFSYAPLSKTVRVSDLAGSVGLQALQKPLNIKYLPVSGNLALALDNAKLKLNPEQQTLPEELLGRIQLRDVEWKLGTPAPLGHFQAELSMDEEGALIANIPDSEQAKLSLNGQVQLNPDFSYLAQLRVKPDADTPSHVANQMKALGRTDSQGWYNLKHQGRLPKF